MLDRSELVREIVESPAGSAIGAFFDVDRTLLAGFSVVEFVRDGVESGRLGTADLLRTVASGARFQLGRLDFPGFVAGSSGSLRGVEEAEFRAIGERIFRERLAAGVYPEARELVRAHRRRRHTLAIVSSATRYQIEPLARDLGIEHVLCTELELRHGRFTGRVAPPVCYGAGKVEAARRFAAERGVDLSRSWFYSDSEEDLPLLEAVGRPRPTNPSWRLAAIAARRGWPARTFTSLGAPGLTEALRTSLAIGGLVPAFLLGLPAAVLDRDWRRAVNVASSVWGEVGTALAGVELRVEGEEHVWSQRPAVFVFNHQSGIDMLLLCKLLKRDFIGVAKEEVRRNPVFGPFFRLAGTVFVDRSNPERAVRALEPAIEALRSGLSIVVAPEGTRSSTPRPGPFKKGAFRLAMEAGVPIVPIVFKNAAEALPRHAVLVRPATVEAVVHPPISTRGWTVKGLERRIAAVRALYLKTLDA